SFSRDWSSDVCSSDLSRNEIVSGCGKLRDMPGEKPVLREDPVQLELVDLGVCVETLLQRPAGLLAGNKFRNASLVLHVGVFLACACAGRHRLFEKHDNTG